MAIEVLQRIKTNLQSVNIPLFLLVCFFAVSSWVDINGVWVELPLFVRKAPESWKLASYIVVVIQIANVGPLAYTIAKTLRPNAIEEWPVIIIVISVGLTSSILLIFFWDETTPWAGVAGQRSTGLLVLSLFLSLVDCTSSVLYITYMSSFHSVYMTALFVGEGLSGLIPGILGLAQLTDEDQWVPNVVRVWVNTTEVPPLLSLSSSSSSSSSSSLTTKPFVAGWVNETQGYKAIYAEPRFSVEVFLILISILLLTSLTSFCTIHFLPFFNKFRHEKKKDGEKKEPEDEDKDQNGVRKNVLPKAILMLLITAWINGLTNGVLPSLQTYSAKSYSNMAYNLHVKLSVLVNPLACFVTLFFTVKKPMLISLMTLVGTALTAYQIALASLSPSPPAKGTTTGEVFVVLTQVLLVAIFSFVKVAIAIAMSTYPGRHWLLFYGLSEQMGSLIGAVITFCLVNFTTLFKEPF